MASVMKFKALPNGSGYSSLNTVTQGLVKIFTVGAQYGLVIDGCLVDRFATLDAAVRTAECKATIIQNFGEIA
jgi:hypothetical protein|tara:strand:+ start:424 stop:642 length:219 start_codon:yes stop_codon:yes gene_type:complete